MIYKSHFYLLIPSISSSTSANINLTHKQQSLPKMVHFASFALLVSAILGAATAFPTLTPAANTTITRTWWGNHEVPTWLPSPVSDPAPVKNLTPEEYFGKDNLPKYARPHGHNGPKLRDLAWRLIQAKIAKHKGGPRRSGKEEGGALEKRGEMAFTQKELEQMEGTWVQGVGMGKDRLEKRGDENGEIEEIEEEILVLLSELMLERDMEVALAEMEA
jgi:hypothetical protein